MSKDKTYTQCLLRRGSTEIVGFIETYAAIVGTTMDVDHHPGRWTVAEVYSTTYTAEQMRDARHRYSGWRAATDI